MSRLTENMIKEIKDSLAWNAGYAVEQILEIGQKAQLLDALHAADPDASVSINCIWITGDRKRLYNIWGAFRQQDWEPRERLPAELVTESRTTFTKGTLTYSLYFTSSVCRRVQIGTQMVEQPIYEIRCGEEQNAEIAEAVSEVATSPQSAFVEAEVYSPTDSCDSPAPCEDGFRAAEQTLDSSPDRGAGWDDIPF